MKEKKTKSKGSPKKTKGRSAPKSGTKPGRSEGKHFLFRRKEQAGKPTNGKAKGPPAKTVPAGMDHTPRPQKTVPAGVKAIGLRKQAQASMTPVDVCEGWEKKTAKRK